MFYRFLGKMFFLFWICPKIASSVKFVTHVMADVTLKKIKELTPEDKSNTRRPGTRQNHRRPYQAQP